MVYFIGAGPGDPGLLTIKGKEVLSRADVVIYAGSLVNPALLSYARPDAAVHNSAVMTLDEVIAVMAAAEERGRITARLHTGDPSLYGALFEQLSALSARGISYEIIPGVSAVFAAAAALGLEYTLPGVSQSLILTRAPGRTDVPESETLFALASHGTSMALYLSAAMAKEVRDALLLGAYTEETPCAVVYKASWPEEKVFRGTLGELPELMEAHGITKTALIIVGEVLAAEADLPAAGAALLAADAAGDGDSAGVAGATHEARFSHSRLYAPDFSTGYRDAADGQTGAVLSFTERGAALAEHVKETLKKEANIRYYAHGADFSDTTAFVGKLFSEVNFLLFIGAAGIAVRTIAPHIKSKATDPAVLVMDEAGQHVISLLSGHLGQANRWAERISAAVGAVPVITTATDVRGAFAVDTYAAEHGFSIEDPAMIKEISARVLRGGSVGVYAEEAYAAAGEALRQALLRGIASAAHGDHAQDTQAGHAGKTVHEVSVPQRGNTEPDALPEAGITIVMKTSAPRRFAKECRLYPKNLCVGIGCKKGKSAEEIFSFISKAFAAADLPACRISTIASIEQKRGEPGLIALAKMLRVPFRTYPAEELSAVAFPGETADDDFSSSAFVEAAVGTDNVCERSAVRAAGEGARLLIRKTAKDGMTLAVAEKTIT